MNEGKKSIGGEIFPEDEGGIKIGDIYIPPIPPASPPACFAETVGRRLILIEIKVENFKSFAGKQSLGPFQKNFTSIIGPNGSGKSNIVDSMLFVFGCRASKIRSKKISTLIHNSPQHQNILSCSVSVSFCLITDKPNDNYEEVPNSHFSITRTAFMDNSSYYTLNGMQVKFKEVATLLQTHGVDLVYNRFLILQKEIEQIAMMKPKRLPEHESGMLEYLEDIIGTYRFKEPIEKLVKKVDELTRERSEQMIRVKLAGKECDFLRGPAKKAVEFLQEENNVVLKKNYLFQKYIYSAHKKVERNLEEKNAIENGLELLNEDLIKFEDERAVKYREIKKLKTDLNEISSKKDKLNDELKNVTPKNITMAEEIVQKKKKLKIFLQIKKQEEIKLNEFKTLLENNQKRVFELKKLQGKLKNEKAKEEVEIKKTLASLQRETVELQDEKEKYETELLALKKIVLDSKSKHQKALSNMDIYVSNEQKEKVRLEQLKAMLRNITTSLEMKRNAMKNLSNKLQNERIHLQEASNEIIRVREEEEVTAKAVQKHMLLTDQVRDMMQMKKSRNKILNYLTKKKQSGEITGVFGRLGDMGAIDEKYDVAISTACGPLDFVVVDNVETGEAIIQALKRDNIGRTTIICLDKQEHLRKVYSKPFQAPENVLRLFDLVRVADDRVRPAFFYALRNTLVAKDIEQAERIAYGSVRHRVVTLDGDLIETCGTITGGGEQKCRGRMGNFISNVTKEVNMIPEQMRQRERKVIEVKDKLWNLRKHANVLENTIITCKNSIEAWTMEFNKYSVELKSLEKQESELLGHVKYQEVNVKAAENDKALVKHMSVLVSSTKKELVEAEKAAGLIELKVNNIHKKIMDKVEGKMMALQKKLDDINKKLDNVTSELAKLNVGMKMAERNAKISSEKIENCQSEIEKCEQILHQMSEEKGNLVTEAAELVRMMERVTTSIEKKSEEKEQLIVFLSNLIHNVIKLKKHIIVELHKVEIIDREIKEQRMKIAKFKSDLKKLKLHKIPNESAVKVLKILKKEELEVIDSQKLVNDITALEKNLSKKMPNLSVINGFNERTAVYNERNEELDNLTTRIRKYREWLNNVCRTRLNEFQTGFTIIKSKLKEIYQKITHGGDAELELVDSLDPFSEGIIFSVRPPMKSWRNVSNISGGEKTLASLALVFALHYYKPSPLYVIDEIDAALDYKNVSNIKNYIKDRTKNAQFIIISLQSNMFELTERLVGVYKVENCSQSITINTGVYFKPPYCNELSRNTLVNDNKEVFSIEESSHVKNTAVIDLNLTSLQTKEIHTQQNSDAKTCSLLKRLSRSPNKCHESNNEHVCLKKRKRT